MSIRYSLVIPTRNRPDFVYNALKFLEHQNHNNFEVVISDNFTDPKFSVKEIVNKAKIKNIKYLQPPRSLGMVENWNYALNYVEGDYISYFTDKMFLLPNVLNNIDNVLNEKKFDIINWIDNSYYPLKYPYYFGEGIYAIQNINSKFNLNFVEFDPSFELFEKTDAKVSRNEQSRESYTRGKICFGFFSRSLIDRIILKTGNLFHDISPDYTSMILGLSLAESAAQLISPGIVHIHTDLSNGGKSSVSDAHARDYLSSLQNYPKFLEDCLIPGLYSSTSNCVTHDYLYIKNICNFNYSFNKVNWLSYIYEDLNIDCRIWSSDVLKNEHINLYNSFVENNLTFEEKAILDMRIKNRFNKNKLSLNNRSLKKFVRVVKNRIPIIKKILHLFYRDRFYVDSVFKILYL